MNMCIYYIQCRCKVERISKNHLVNNLVDAFLRANPGVYVCVCVCQVYMNLCVEKRRPEEDLKELNENNKITRDMVYTHNV